MTFDTSNIPAFLTGCGLFAFTYGVGYLIRRTVRGLLRAIERDCHFQLSSPRPGETNLPPSSSNGGSVPTHPASGGNQ